MADEEVMGAGSPPPTEHKRKLDDLDSEPLDQPTATNPSNGNSESSVDVVGHGEAPVNGVAPEDPEVKRPRLDDKPDDFEATKNGHQEERGEESKEDVRHQEEREDEPKQDVAVPSAVENNTEQEEGQGKANEPVDAVNKEPVTDEIHTSAIEQQSADNPEESAKGEHQELSEEHQDPLPDATLQGDVSGGEQQPTSAGQLTSRKMEVPSNKVGVLIGKAGDTIRTLQYNSGARIQITRDADADPRSATRPVELIGSLENINKAEKLIMDVIAEADAGGSPSLVARGFSTVQSSGASEQVQIQVPNEKVGLIIGRGGETIKNLQTRSGARIQLIPQHLPEGDQSKERTVRVTGDKKQIEMAREMINEAMNQPIRSPAPTSGYNQQSLRPRGPGSQWGPRSHPLQSTRYDYPQKGPYPSQNPQYPSQGYGNYPPQQLPSRNNFGWEQRPPTNMQGPPEHTGYDYYGGQGGHTAPPSGPPPMNSHAPMPAMDPPPSQANYNYGQPQGPDYGQQQTPYPQTAPQGYGHGYGEAKYDSQGLAQHPYGAHGPPSSAYPQGATHPGYGQQDQYGKPPAYSMPQQGPYTQPYGQPRPSQPGDGHYQGPLSSTPSYGPNAPVQQPYPYPSSGPMQQAYTQYASAPANDGYSHSAPGPGGYPQQSGQPVSGYAQAGGLQQAPVYAQSGPAASYGQYPTAQPGFIEQAPTNNAGYGYQGAADGTYAGGPGTTYGAPPVGQPAAYSQPAPTQPGYDQSIPQSGGYGNVPIPYGKSVSPQPQPQPGYAQYDSSQMYVGHR